MKTLLFVILTAAITNNYVLVKFLGICPFLGVSKKLDQATGMSIAVIFVEVLATAVTWPIYHLLLAGKVDFTYMETVVFILVIAALVQLVEIVLKRYIPALHKALGVYLPLITTNCGVLGVTMNDSETIEAETSVMGRPSKLLGGSASSTRERTPEKMTIARKKPRPQPSAVSSEST